MALRRADHPGSLPPPYAVSVGREKEQSLEILLIQHAVAPPAAPSIY